MVHVFACHLACHLLLAAVGPITFAKDFEGASLGKIEKLGDTRFRVHVQGQSDARGRNRQASWHYFRMDGVQGREITLTFTDYVGEYNDKPGACPMNADTAPVFSHDNQEWRHFAGMVWDDQKKEATLTFRPERDSIWIAHQPPYTHRRLLDLLAELNRSPHVLVEVIGKSVQGRDLHLVTVTNPDIPDEKKKTVWLQARQHAWESGTSHVMDGALRFVASDDAEARALRDRVVFKFTPMVDPDGAANGTVRFNVHGYDVNRHGQEIDLRHKEILGRMPESWYVKKALQSSLDSGHGVALMVNMHNTESGEYMNGGGENARRLFDRLVQRTSFDPSRPLGAARNPGRFSPALMELRIGTVPKLKRQATVADRLTFGRQLIQLMAETALEAPYTEKARRTAASLHDRPTSGTATTHITQAACLVGSSVCSGREASDDASGMISWTAASVMPSDRRSRLKARSRSWAVSTAAL